MKNVKVSTIVLVLCGLFVTVYKCFACPPPNQDPEADLTANPGYAMAGVDVVTLDGSNSTDDGTIVKYEWDFTADGTYDYYETSGYHPDGAFDKKTTHTYIRPSNPDSYTVRLRVTDNLNATGEDTCTVYVGRIKNVDQDEWFDTIQAAINDAAPTSDERIIVAEGIYTGSNNRNIDFGGKEITVRSTDIDDPAVVANTIIDCEELGRGFYFHNSEGSDSVLAGFTITNGSATDGGGIYCYSASPKIKNCVISNNQAYGTGELEGGGGGIFCNDGASPIITNCIFSSNSAKWGGGIYSYDNSSPNVKNCVFSGNHVQGHSSYSHGGGMFHEGGSSPTVINCTFSNNSAVENGGGIANFSTHTLTNCIFWGNNASTCNELYGWGNPTYCCIKGWSLGGTGNTNNDPLFRNIIIPVGPDGVFCTWDDGLRTMAYGSCVDAAKSSGAPETDITGRGRVDVPYVSEAPGASIYDIGAYESPTVWFVDADADLLGDGESWSTAFKFLQDALYNGDLSSSDKDEIWVADGPYYPDKDEGENVTEDERTETFELIGGIAVYGGFAADADDGERNWTEYQSILSGDIDGDGLDDDDSYHVVTGADNAVLDGFIITGGYADGSDSNAVGGGIYCSGVSPTISNCVISENSADGGGGGMRNYSSSLTISNCVFSGNSSSSFGGGMYNGGSSPTITNCVFFNNFGGSGGGIYNDGSSPTLINCTFTKNEANTSDPRCKGGGMANKEGSHATVTNCIFWDNDAYSYNEIYNSSSYPFIKYCDIEGCGGSSSWSSLFGIDGGGNIDSNPDFNEPGDPDGDDDAFCTSDDGLRLSSNGSSPCIDVGDNDAISLNTDIAGHIRKQDDPDTTDGGNGAAPIVDMGAYEFPLRIVVMCWIDESDPYQGSSGEIQFNIDLYGYHNVIGMTLVKSGCLVPSNEAKPHPITDVLPSGYDPPPPGIDIENCGRPPTKGELIEDFGRIRDGVTPDELILIVDNSGSMDTDDLQPGYGQFKTWVEDNYGNIIHEYTDFGEAEEDWINTMLERLQDVLE